MSALLSVEGLSVVAPHESMAPLVDDVSFRVPEGSALGMVGESGCGKTMTARALIDLLPPGCRRVAGRIRLNGLDLGELRERDWCRVRGASIGFVFQEPRTALNPVRTIGSQLIEAIRLHRTMTRVEARREAIELLSRTALTGVESRLGDYPHQFSGGELQRVAIALALSGEPRLLIADEPTAALDATIRSEILRLLGELRRELGLTLILVTHALGVVARLCDSVVVMYAGRIVEHGPTPEVLDGPGHPYTEGLLAAAPRLGRSGARERLPTIPGQVPQPDELPPGCAFHPRCPAVMPRCRVSPPPQYTVASSRQARCYLHAQDEPRSIRRRRHP